MSKKQITVPVFIPHEGCPHRCAFCNQIKSSGYSPERDRNSVESSIRRYTSFKAATVERTELAFFGGSFTALPIERQKQLLEAVRPYLDSGEIDTIRLSTRPDCISTDILDLLRSSRVETVELGAQSFHDDVLNAANRGHTSSDTVNAIDLLRQYGFKTVIQLMPGLPLDTHEKSIESSRKAVYLKPDAVRIYPTVVIRGTELETLHISGKYIPLELNEAVDLCADMHEIFSEADIPVIRTGLHPLEADDTSSIIAGPYHCSFGFFVKSRLARRRLHALILQNSRDSFIDIKVPEAEAVEYIGYKRENIIWLESFFSIKVRISASDVTEPELHCGLTVQPTR